MKLPPLGLLKARRLYSNVGQEASPKSRHAQVYTNTIPAMIPVILLGSAVYLGLQLAQLKLSHEKYVDEATKRIKDLEIEINTLQESRTKQPNGKPPPEPTLSFWWWRK